MANTRTCARHPPLLFLLLLVFLLPSFTEEEEPISVGAPITAVEEGDTAEIVCSSTEKKTPRWYIGSNHTGKQPILEDDSSRIFSSATTGTLTVKKAMLNDTGMYLCLSFSKEHQVTAELHVYEMPSYMTEGMIILGISSVLLVVLLGGMLHQFVQKCKKSRVEKAKLQRKMKQEA